MHAIRIFSIITDTDNAIAAARHRIRHRACRSLSSQLRDSTGAMVTQKVKSTREPQIFALDKVAPDRGANGTLCWDSIAPFADAGFKAVFDSSAEALLVVDAAGVIQKANPRA